MLEDRTPEEVKRSLLTIRNQLIRNYRWNRLPSPPRKPLGSSLTYAR